MEFISKKIEVWPDRQPEVHKERRSLIIMSMRVTKLNPFHALLALILALGITSCQNLPGSKGSQGAVIGGLGGAAAGAAIGHSALGALLGGALGAGAGYII